MKLVSDYINFSTKGNTDILDITEEVVSRLKKAKLKDGIVNISVLGSTSAITTCEYEPALINDLKKTFEDLIPKHKGYDHDATWQDGNAHSHLRALIVGSNLAVSFVDGQLYLGTWQQIIFIDFDNRARRRKVLLQFIGE
ncbi:MAG: secondary thiamine-phosphate synthase enzyme YjbQ [Candidatus Omnitrophota bacterium]